MEDELITVTGPLGVPTHQNRHSVLVFGNLHIDVIEPNTPNDSMTALFMKQ